MADSNFITPTPPSVEQLTTLPDSSKIPNLTGYTMGDLRELFRSEQKTDSWVQKSQLRQGSYPDQSILPRKLDDDYARPRVIYQIQNYDISTTALGGWQPAWSGGAVALGASWGYFDPEQIPYRDGFYRQYRVMVGLYYGGGTAGTTGANILVVLSDGSFTSGTLTIANPGTNYDALQTSGWLGIDTTTTQGTLPIRNEYYVNFTGNYVTANPGPQSAIRFVTIDVRYVRI